MKEARSELKVYRTSQIAKLSGVHPNTVRLYEELGFIPPVPRQGNGYRVYSEKHLWHMRLARTALRCDFVIGDIRRRAAQLVKKAADGDLEEALSMAYDYLAYVRKELGDAEEALSLAQRWIDGKHEEQGTVYLGRSDVAKLLETTIDILRNWERNGLADIPRDSNNYRLYGPREISRLKIIRTLRKANYSMMSILRMMGSVESGYRVDLRSVMNTPLPEEDIISAADRLICTLVKTKADANDVITQLRQMTDRFN